MHDARLAAIEEDRNAMHHACSTQRLPCKKVGPAPLAARQQWDWTGLTGARLVIDYYALKADELHWMRQFGKCLLTSP